MSEWQPIETFFKRSDKTGKVLLFIPGVGVTEGGCEFTGFHIWKTAFGIYCGGKDGDSEKLRSMKVNGPTHWMPLPDQPQDAA